ncbi:DUF4365 domain-containing protein [uncultured Brevundimonas sp.]|uniref:DUF4365 domain-containing protein n=1 Tax=uncultured Brevundimonas sp. TaxID=213418 RepID=UPI00262ADF53|nr:DUF4365 domain-containing protein [uncultured Brevundimonas sp.]
MLGDDALLAPTDVEEAYSIAYVHAISAGLGYVVSQKNFDRDGIDLTIEAGDGFRPKLDIQLKATINLKENDAGIFRYPCKKRNYDLLREPTQTPRLLVVLHLPSNANDWLTVTPSELVLRNCAYWANLLGAPEVENETSVTIDLPKNNRFDIDGLKALMDQSRTGKIL